jgi:ParB family chromosome partitioning protein
VKTTASLDLSVNLDALDVPPTAEGQPLRVPIHLVEEDPLQPRTEFDAASVQALAESIRSTGEILEPIVVRPHPDKAGAYMIRYGARRRRAAELAGLVDIPILVKEGPVDRFAQFIENQHREDLSPLDLAKFIKDRLAETDETGRPFTKARIAQRLAVDPAVVTFASAMIDPPAWLLEAYHANKCTGRQELYELRRLAEKYPGSVEQWTGEQEVITRAMVARLRATITSGPDAAVQAQPLSDGSRARTSTVPAAVSPTPASSHETAVYPDKGLPPAAAPQPALLGSDAAFYPDKEAAAVAGRVVLVAQHKGMMVEVLANVMPRKKGFIVVRPLGGGKQTQVPAPELVLVEATRI